MEINELDEYEEDELEARLYEKVYYSSEMTENNLDCNFNSSQVTEPESCETTAENAKIAAEKTISNNETSNELATSAPMELISELPPNSDQPETRKRMRSNDEKSSSAKKSKCGTEKKQKKKSKKSMEDAKKEKQRAKVLSKRKAIREQSENPLKTKRSRQMASLYCEDEDTNDCIIVEDELQQTEPIEIDDDENDDEEEGNAKYSIESKKQKKLKKLSEVEESDSEGSIFEVPVPPKPAPVIVNLDSDEEANNVTKEDELETFLSDDEAANPREGNTTGAVSIDSIGFEDEEEEESNSPINETNENEEHEDEEDVEDDGDVDENEENEESEDMILNCTDGSKGKGASSLEEIKRLGQGVEKDVETREDVDVGVGEKSSCTPSKKASLEQQATHNQQQSQRNCPMSKSMRDFYNNSWGGENFELDEVLSKMPEDRNRWAILDEDMNTNNRLSRYWEVCKGCNKPGHTKKKCPNDKRKLGVKICHMCGATGHLEMRCPQRMCLTCGTHQNTFRKTCENCRRIRCNACKSVGHTVENCPDNWRQFHNITSEDQLPIPMNKQQNIMKPRSQLFCCNCTLRGHDSTSCNRYRWSLHFPTPSFVSNYNVNIHVSQPVPNPLAKANTRHSLPIVPTTPKQKSIQNPYNTRSSTDLSCVHSLLDLNIPSPNLPPNLSPILNTPNRMTRPICAGQPLLPTPNQTFQNLIQFATPPRPALLPTPTFANPNYQIPTTSQFQVASQSPVSTRITNVTTISPAITNSPNTQSLNTNTPKLSPPKSTKKTRKTILRLFDHRQLNFRSYKESVKIVRNEAAQALIEQKSNVQFLFQVNQQTPFNVTIEWPKTGTSFQILYQCSRMHKFLGHVVMLWMQRTPLEQKHMLCFPAGSTRLLNFIEEAKQRILKDYPEPDLLYEEFLQIKAKMKQNVTDDLVNAWREKLTDLVISVHKYGLTWRTPLTHLQQIFGRFHREKPLYLNPHKAVPKKYLKLIVDINNLFAPYEMANIEELIAIYKQRKNSDQPFRQLSHAKLKPLTMKPEPNKPKEKKEKVIRNKSNCNGTSQTNVIEFVHNLMDQSLPANSQNDSANSQNDSANCQNDSANCQNNSAHSQNDSANCQNDNPSTNHRKQSNLKKEDRKKNQLILEANLKRAGLRALKLIGKKARERENLTLYNRVLTMERRITNNVIVHKKQIIKLAKMINNKTVQNVNSIYNIIYKASPQNKNKQ